MLYDLGLTEAAATSEALDLLQQVAGLIEETPRKVLLARAPESQAEQNKEIIESAAESKAALSGYFQVLGLNIKRISGIDVRELEKAAGILQGAGKFGFLRPSVRGAKRLHSQLLSKLQATTVKPADALLELADAIHQYQLFDDHESRLAVACGEAFQGFSTDFETLQSAANFAASSRDRFPPSNKINQAARKFLEVAKLEELERFCYGVKQVRDQLDELDSRVEPSVAFADQVKSAKKELIALNNLSQAAANLALIPTTRFAQLRQLTEWADVLTDLSTELEQDSEAANFLGAEFDGASTDVVALANHLEALDRLDELRLDARSWHILLSPGHEDLVQQRNELVDDISEAFDQLRNNIAALQQVTRVNDERWLGDKFKHVALEKFVSQVERCLNEEAALPSLIQYERARVEAAAEPFIEQLLSQGASLTELSQHFEKLIYTKLLENAFDRYPVLRRFSGQTHEQIRSRFADLDREIIALERSEIPALLLRKRIPLGRGTGRRRDYTELSAIEQQTSLQRPSWPIRKLLKQAGRATQQLKPCFLMSPLSVGQYLEPGAVEFDLVVIDEASQMLPEDALSSIIRGKQLVVVGDPEQLPPTTFFAFSNQDNDVDGEGDEPPEESILELANTRYKPMRELLFHYRSRHQSLIAFSNKNFYGDRLVVFPSPLKEGETIGVNLVHVEGTYLPGTGINVTEARQVLKASMEFMKSYPDLSLGVATINSKSAEYLQQEFDELYERDSLVRHYIDRWDSTLESFFVKNLENVQGDERDAIFVSTVYGPQENGVFHQRFGPINSPAGYRRLNVLFTRAKQHLRLFTSMRSQDIRLTSNSHRGVRVLKEYIDYLTTGRLETGSVTGREPDSDFERYVVERLRNADFGASCQIGVAGYRIDIGVHDPNDPERFILGIECDGATYHSSESARDRDRIRQDILEGLGWRIYRIWSTDWFADPESEFRKLEQQIIDLAKVSKRVKKVSLSDSSSCPEPTPYGRHVFPESKSAQNGLAVRVGDKVTYGSPDNDFEEFSVVIGSNLGQWSERVVSLDTPVAKGLLGGHEGDEVTLELPKGNERVVIRNIVRAGPN